MFINICTVYTFNIGTDILDTVNKKTLVIVGGIDNTGNATNTARIIHPRDVTKTGDVNRKFFMASGAYLEDGNILIICGGYSGNKQSGPLLKSARESLIQNG